MSHDHHLHQARAGPYARARHQLGISQDEVEATLANPIQRITANHGRVESRGFIDRAGSKQLLRVFSEGQTVVMVITVIATSKFEKYGVSP